MPSWHNILCCDGLSELLRRARYGGLPPTPESAKLVDYLLEHAETVPQQDDPDIPLTLNNYKIAILSVARSDDVEDVTWPVRYFAVSISADEAMKGFMEIQEKKVLAAEAQGVLEDPGASMVERWFGDCAEHPDLLFHIRYRPLREEGSFSCKEGDYNRKENRASLSSLSFSEISEDPEDLIRKVEEDAYEPKIEGDFADGDPLAMVHHPSYPYHDNLTAKLMSMSQASQIGNQPGNPAAYGFPCSYPYQGDLQQKEEQAAGTFKEQPTEEMFMQAGKQQGKHEGREKLIDYDLGPDVDF